MIRSAEAQLAAGGDAREREVANLKNMQQLVQLRWIAVAGQVLTIAVVHFGLGIELPLASMGVVLASLAGFNVASQLRWRGAQDVTNGELFFALLVDVAMLTAQLYFSGGTTNPFVFLYLLQVILGAVLLEGWATWTLVLVTAACFAGLAIFGQPLALPLDHDQGLASPYVQGMLVCFALNAALLVTFVGRIGRNLRERDDHLADLRRRAVEEEHIVRMGLLASGAAHELGTPLATLSVILGDWRRLPHFTSDPELLLEVDEMQAQLARCKRIVSGILLSAGETRGEASLPTTVNSFMDGLVAEWRASRPVAELDYDNRFGEDVAIVADSAVQQMVHNVLDNALEASPEWIGVTVARQGERLTITVRDQGPGFKPSVMDEFGKPYNSTKGRPGAGLGLFLVVNVARTLGGSVSAHNRPEGGAEVTLGLPLAALMLARDKDTTHP